MKINKYEREAALIAAAFQLPVCHIEKCMVVNRVDFILLDRTDNSFFTIFYSIPENTYQYSFNVKQEYILPLHEVCGEEHCRSCGLGTPPIQERLKWRLDYETRLKVQGIEL